MAADEALVRAAELQIVSLRFYGWTSATVSLGYFQSASVRHSDPLLAALPFVRRPSGGATLVHHHELTYCLALPPGAPWQSGEAWMPRMHRIITSALGELGLAGKLEAVNANPVKHGDVLCFQQYTPGDLLSVGKKIVGSAQRKYHQALMQHGSILLAQSEHTPSLPGLRELCGVTLDIEQVQSAVLSAFARDTGWRFYTEEWNSKEYALIRDLIEEKYATKAWNEKR
jgi:lipoate-protein ligase A